MKAWQRAAGAGTLGAQSRAPDRTILFERGQPASMVYFLAEGCVEILQRSAEGMSTVVKLLVAPTLFGAIEALGREEEYLESVRVAGHAAYHAMPRAKFVSLVQSSSELSFACLVDTATAFCIAARMESARLHDTECLLANLICAYADIFGVASQRGLKIDIKRSQSDFAEAIGAGERSVNRILARWQAEGWVTKSQARYYLTRQEPLIQLAEPLQDSLIHRWHHSRNA